MIDTQFIVCYIIRRPHSNIRKEEDYPAVNEHQRMRRAHGRFSVFSQVAPIYLNPTRPILCNQEFLGYTNPLALYH